MNTIYKNDLPEMQKTPHKNYYGKDGFLDIYHKTDPLFGPLRNKSFREKLKFRPSFKRAFINDIILINHFIEEVGFCKLGLLNPLSSLCMPAEQAF